MADEQRNIPAWHSFSVDDTLERLGASRQGLGADESARRGNEQGPNRLTPADKHSAWRRFLAQFANALI